MFTVYHSNQIDVLKSLLAELMKVDPLENPFEKEHILVQSQGMSQWLKLELAKELGIAANIDFALPATFIWDMFVCILDDVPSRSVFNKESITWKLMQILPSQLEKPDFSLLKGYLEQDDDGSKRYQLSEKIANIFDGYLVYRPEWITAWEQGKDVAELSDKEGICQKNQSWQKILWKALYEHTLAMGQSPYHRANLFERFIERLKNGSGQFKNLPKRLFVFGISSLPPFYMEALAALGQHIDVHLMFTNPCRYYWGEVRDRKYLAKLAMKNRQHVEWQTGGGDYQVHGETAQLKGSVEAYLVNPLHTGAIGNSLLASLGKLGRDNMYLLSQLSSNEIEAFVDIEKTTLLNQIQSDILNLEERQDDKSLLSSQHKHQIAKQDSSLTLHACHSPMREIEVLHDRLLEMFETNPSLKPRDVIVMMADINAYSPAIQAVFGNASGKRFIPFSISDRTATQESPLLSAFLRLVTLPQSRCTASEILVLLEVPEVLRRFSLTESEFEKGKRWIEGAGIRWGLDESTAAEFELPETGQNTWLFGIQRMLLGYAVHESVEVFESAKGMIAPYNEAQGIEAELAGKLAHFIDKIIIYRQNLAKTQLIAQWQEQLYRLMDDFFEVDLEGEVALKSIRDSLHQLAEQLNDATYQDLLSPRVLLDYLQSKLSASRVSLRFLAGQVNFCTLMPMRSIPFDVVCLLGMNDGIYPRTVLSEGLDLMNVRSRPGDRSRCDDDRYLFLEALLSAQEKLYISYVARSIQDNSERAPSILVAELLEYCGQNFCLHGDQNKSSDDSLKALIDHLMTQYPIAPFSESAFRTPTNQDECVGLNQYQSYAKEWLRAANREGQQADKFIQTLPDYYRVSEQAELLPLVELQRFWRLPVQYFFNRRLKVFFDSFVSSTEDEEPFVLDNLQSYHLRDELLHAILKARVHNLDESNVYQQFVQKKRAQGTLPIGTLGEIDLISNREAVDIIVDELVFLCQSPLEDIEIDWSMTLGDAPSSYVSELMASDSNSINPVRLTGWLVGVYQSGLVRYRCGKIRSQDWLSAWIDHLCLAIVSESKKTHLIGFDKKLGLEHKVILPVEKEKACLWLSELVQYYFQGLNQPLPYFPRTVLKGMERTLVGKEDSEAKMSTTFSDGYQYQGEGNNAYINRVWPAWSESLYSQVFELGKNVLLNAMQLTKNNQDIES